MDALGVNIVNIVIYTILFGILYFVIDHFLIKMLDKTLEERKKRITEGLQYSDQMEKKLSKTDAMAEKILAKARDDAKQIMEDAKKDVQAYKIEKEKEAKADADEILATAKERADLVLKKEKTSFDQSVMTKAKEMVESLWRSKNSSLDTKYIEDVIKKNK